MHQARRVPLSCAFTWETKCSRKTSWGGGGSCVGGDRRERGLGVGMRERYAGTRTWVGGLNAGKKRRRTHDAPAVYGC